MFYEYALEPRLVASWCDSACFQFCLRQFGLKSQRIISRYPDHWLKLVEDAVSDKTTFIEKNKKTEIRKQVMGRMVKRDSGCYPYEPSLSWHDNVKCVNDKKSFHRIVSTCNPNNIENISIVSDAPDLLTLEEHDSHRRVEREPMKMAEALRPLLLAANHIAFVDPYFDFSDKRGFKAVFQECAKIISERSDRKTIKLEIHTSVERFFYDIYENSIKVSFVKDKPAPLPDNRRPRTCRIEEEKSQIIAKTILREIEKMMRLLGCHLRTVVWKERNKGAQLHNRYVLTEIGGVMFGHGLDKASEARDGKDDVVCLNNEKEYAELWSNYLCSYNPAFDKVLSIPDEGYQVIKTLKQAINRKETIRR